MADDIPDTAAYGTDSSKNLVRVASTSEFMQVTDTFTRAVGAFSQSLDGKQDALSTVQLDACNSGITASKVTVYDGYSSEISHAESVANQAYTEAEAVSSALGDKQDKVASYTVTLTVAGWDTSTKTQSVSCAGVTSSSVIFVTASGDHFIDYYNLGVRCTAQSTDTLVFTCDIIPSFDLTASVARF